MLDTVGQEQYLAEAKTEIFYIGLYTNVPCLIGTNEIRYIPYKRMIMPGYGKWVMFDGCIGGSCVISHFAIHKSQRGIGDFNYQGDITPILYISKNVTPRILIYAPD